MARSQTVPREAEYAVHIPLKPEFRFVHEPITSATQDRFVGRVCDVRSVSQSNPAIGRWFIPSDGLSWGWQDLPSLNQVIEQLKLKFRANSEGILRGHLMCS